MEPSQHSDFLEQPTAAIQRGGLPLDAITSSHTDPEKAYPNENLIVVVDRRTLERECLARGLVAHNPTWSIALIRSLDEFQNMPNGRGASAILVILGARKISDQSLRAELVHFVSDIGDTPIIVVADSDEPADMLAALEVGARGYIPTSVSVKIAARAIGLALAGGVFVPASTFLRLREVIPATPGGTRRSAGVLTKREVGVAEAIRKGKPNKIIAYELNLRESTIKVHIRNIMKKLNATNRTQVVFKLSGRDD